MDTSKIIQLSSVGRLEQSGAIATLLIDNPPINAISQAVRATIVQALKYIEQTPDILALILKCSGRTFCAGADINEFGKLPLEPFLPDVIESIETCSKPVIAALHGTALGGGLEIAMGCHARVAVRTAKLGLPEVKLGLLPGAGGTQRLPRLIGIEKALTMMTSGVPITALAAFDMGLVDLLVDEQDLQKGAEHLSQEIISGARQLSRSCDRLLNTTDISADYFDRFLTTNAKKFARLEAPKAIVDVVRQGINLTFKQALANERQNFLTLQAGDQSKALRYAFLAERQTSKIPHMDASIPRLPINTVGIIGAGTMGTGIALNFLLAGISVILIERDAMALERGKNIIAQTLTQNVKTGRLSEDKMAVAFNLLTPALEISALAGVDLVIEAAFETMDVKRSIFSALSDICTPQCILATNTSYLNVDEIAAVTSRPAQVVGLHFFSPANIMKLLEIVKGAKTAPHVLMTALDLAKRIGKIPVVSGVCRGFIGNRMLAARRVESDALILEGASPYAVDRALEDFGFPMGPFRMADLAGLDLGWSREISTGSTVRDRLCELDRRGQKSGAGFYDYTDGRTPVQSPLVETLIQTFAAEKNIKQHSTDDSEICARLLFPMINEAAKILEEKIALRGSDIDMVWVHGYGWPAWRGGPLYWADQIGIDKIIATLNRFEKELGPRFAPAPLLLATAASNGSLSTFSNSVL
jgi:3-hydroxyacyl-CoA dehydrogenase